MSQEQYNTLLSNLLRERCALAKLRVELEGRKGKLCRSCKGFRHLAQNCRNKKEKEKGTAMPQNKFEILSSRVMQYGVEERIVRSARKAAVRCFKCGEEGHKCRECPLWERKVKRVVHPREGKVHQGERRLACPVREKVQEEERKLRRVEEEKAVCPVQGKTQQEWKRSSMEELRKKAEKYCGKGVPEEARLLELGWYTLEIIVTYNECRGCGRKGSYAEGNRGQGVLQDKTFWCRCRGKKEEKAARPREAKVQQGGAQSGEPESAAKEGSSRKEVRRTFKMLREMWLNIGVEKIDIHEGVMIQALLDSGTMGMFMDKWMAARHGFKLQKLERPIAVRNVDGTNNSGGAITH